MIGDDVTKEVFVHIERIKVFSRDESIGSEDEYECMHCAHVSHDLPAHSFQNRDRVTVQTQKSRCVQNSHYYGVSLELRSKKYLDFWVANPQS